MRSRLRIVAQHNRCEILQSVPRDNRILAEVASDIDSLYGRLASEFTLEWNSIVTVSVACLMGLNEYIYPPYDLTKGDKVHRDIVVENGFHH